METHQAYSADPRIPCKFGRKCYQKNPNHHNKYKHPPDPKRKNQFVSINNNSKKIKLNDDRVEKETKVNDSSTNDIGNDAGILSEPNIEASKKEHFSNDVSDDSDTELTNGNSSSHENLVKDTSDHSETISNSSNNDEIKDNTICNHKGHNNEKSRDLIKSKFLFEMPEDFYKFFDFCELLNPTNPGKALESIGLELVGPFDVLSGKFCGVVKKNEDYLIHWRYYYDPPNFQTVLKGDDKTGYHIGYFRDSPDQKPVFLTENCGLKDGILRPLGGNIFGAVSSYIDDYTKTCDPFSKMKLKKIHMAVKQEAEKLGYDLTSRTKDMIKRNNKVLSRTFNKVGLIVPYERKTQLGYRKLAMTDKALEVLLSKIHKAEPEEKPKYLAELQSEILTWTDIACDECDFGTGIELGWDILCHGVDLNHTTARLLASNYRQLKWEAFAKIAEAHMSNRRKGCNLSIL